MGYVIGAIVVLAIVLWFVLRRQPDDPNGATAGVTEPVVTEPTGSTDAPELSAQERFADSGFPVSADQPDVPPPGERVLPDFQWPRILSVEMPGAPECGLTYPLIYTDLFQYLSGCGDFDAGVASRHHPALLRRAREQAAVYCHRHQNPDCRGVNEISHSFSYQCFQADGATYVGVTINYFFECNGQAEGGSEPPSVTELPLLQGEPNCSSEYHFIAHHTSQILNDCNSPDRPAIEERKARELLEAAQNHARGFCAGARQETCRIPVALGHDIDHHCFRSEPEDAWFHTSTIIYFFACPPTA